MKELTKKFLIQYKIRNEMGRDEGDEENLSCPDDSAAREECAKRVRPFDTDIKPGQIRMLTGTERPTQVVVLRKWGDMWLIVPLSDYSYPAMYREIATDVGVAQIWNARTIHGEILAKGWDVRSTPEGVMKDLLRVWSWYMGQGDLSDKQMERMGDPIMKPDDPRLKYEDEELANFAKLDAEDMCLAFGE